MIQHKHWTCPTCISKTKQVWAAVRIHSSYCSAGVSWHYPAFCQWGWKYRTSRALEAPLHKSNPLSVSHINIKGQPYWCRVPFELSIPDIHSAQTLPSQSDYVSHTMDKKTQSGDFISCWSLKWSACRRFAKQHRWNQTWKTPACSCWEKDVLMPEERLEIMSVCVGVGVCAVIVTLREYEWILFCGILRTSLSNADCAIFRFQPVSLLLLC